MKIKTKLISIYLIGALLSCLTIVFVIGAFSSIRSDFNDVMNNPVRKLEALKKIEGSVLRILASTNEFGLIIAEKKEEENNNKKGKQNEELLENESENAGSNEEKELINSGIGVYQKAFAEYDELVKGTSNNEEDFLNDIKTEGDELILISSQIIKLKQQGVSGKVILENKEKLELAEKKILNTLEKSTNHQYSLLNEKQTNVEKTISNSTINTLLLSVFALFVAIIGGYVFSNSVTKSINKLKQASYRIGNGDLNFEFEVNSLDEIGELADDFKKMTSHLKETRKEILIGKNFVENIFSSMADMLLVVDDDGIIESVNEATLSNLGFPENELVGQKVRILNQENSFLTDEEYECLLERKKLVEVEKEFVRKNGEKINVLISASILHGKTAAAVLVAKDISKIKNDEQKLRQFAQELIKSNKEFEKLTNSYKKVADELRKSESELITVNNFTKNIMDSMVDFVLVVDFDLKIKQVNPAALKLNGYQEHELVGKSVNLLIADKPFNSKGIESLRRFGFVKNLEKLNRCKNGNIIPISISMSVLKDEQGNDTAIVCVGKDTSESVKARRSIEESNERLRQSNRELEDFAYVASHDLQEPLRKVQAFGDRLERKYVEILPAEGQDYIKRMRDAASRMQRLINDLLTFSRVTTKAQPFESVDVKKITEEVISDLEVRIEETKGSVEIGDLPKIEGDPTQFRQLLQNLIGNSLKFHQSGKSPNIRIYSQDYMDKSASFTLSGEAVQTTGGSENFCQIVVQDNGIGFDEKYLDRIFTVFQRLHGRTEYEGSGVGLAVCRKIVERHRGTITAKSKEGEGSTFLITLPINQTQQEIFTNETRL